MEKGPLCIESDNAALRELSAVLVARGYEAAEEYSVTEDGTPFLKLPCPILEDGEEIEWFLFIDVEPDGEYLMQTFFSHSHFGSAEDLADQVDLLRSGRLAEVGLSFPSASVHASFYVENTGDPEENVSVVGQYAQAISDMLLECMPSFPASVHRYFEASSPLSKDRTIHLSRMTEEEIAYVDESETPYMTSCVIGLLPEIYLLA